MGRSEVLKALAGMTMNDSAFDAVSSEISSHVKSAVPQPLFIIGESGSGKTTLLKRLYGAEQSNEIEKVWIDGRTVFTSEDITSKVPATADALVFVDDLDFYLTRSPFEEQYRLRRFLYNAPAPMLIATVSQILPAMTDYEAPFFEGVKNIFIPPTGQAEIARIFSQQEKERAETLMNLLPPTVRSLETIASIIDLNSCPEKDVEALITLFSEKYRRCYAGLPTNSQHILNALARGGGNLNMANLRESTGLPTHVLTAYLRTLGIAKLLMVDRSQKKNTKYSVKDPLFQLWLSS